ncbi:MAG: hypothetical protein M5R36_13100 [Deltaproteobacteria bacterium]|nr:hypothetical protein [Deltaproteobacteria bacterium]
MKMRAGEADVYEEGANYTSLIRDSRRPDVVKPTVSAARFSDDGGATVATLVNWHSHPEVTISTHEISSDFPHYLRERMEALYGGTSVYVSGAVGGLQTPLSADVPAVDENGDRVLDDETPVFLRDQSFEKSRSLGFVLAEYAQAAIDGADLVTDLPVNVAARELTIPLHNPFLWFIEILGILDYEDDVDVIWDRPFECAIACAVQNIALARVGPLAIGTSPGETFPETLIGREASSYDYGGGFGVFNFPAMDGYEEALDAEVKMHLGLTGDEAGYIVPHADYHAPAHPDFYEEGFCLGTTVETIYRNGMLDLIGP